VTELSGSREVMYTSILHGYRYI